MNQNYVVKPFTALLFLQVFTAVVKSSFDPFMDSNLFSIKWHGPLDLNQEEVELLGDRHVMITTSRKENYRCILPDALKQAEDAAASYKGPSVDELMQPLFRQQHCSYRIESYWTYELCHGKHLKQYHETKEQGMQPKVQEYYLGFGNHRDTLKEESEEPEKPETPVREVDGVELPFYEVIMGDGTKCDLTGQPRKAHVMYVCHTEGRGEIYELKESSTCEYEVLVLSSSLCKHPKYRPKAPPVTEIRCHAMFGSPLKPLELSKAENEMRYLQDAGKEYQSQQESTPWKEPQRDPKFIRKTKTEEDLTQEKVQREQQAKLGAVTDKQTLRDFFSGGQCLGGGTGWWKHEVCFGKFAKQFHLDKDGEINIFLGHWDKEKHLAWLNQNPQKRPKPVESRKFVSLYYSNGDICDLTKKPRNCEVRLKCLQSIRNPHAVILSLAEPETCQYVLTVESALFCSVLKDADENGLFDHLDL